jgi:flagellar hook-associated protein 2
MATLRLGGITSGFDTESLIQKILDVDRLRVARIQSEKNVLSVQQDAVSAIQSSLSNLKSTLANLKESSFFNSNKVNVSNTDVATAIATTSAAKSTYALNITSIASASILRSGTSLGPAAQKIANTITETATLSSNSSYGSSLTLGTFTINGASITIDSDDKLNDGGDVANSVFHKINTATGGVVSAAYNAATDTITLTAGSGTLTLGSGSDTSDFLSRSRLYTNGTNTVSSLTSIGNIDTAQNVGDAASRIAAAATLTSGTITVNGVSISVDKDNDTLTEILDRITESTAGVFASYDSIEDRIVLLSKTTGSIGITIADGTSNFASSMKLTTSTSQLAAGNDTTFTIDGGVTRKSTDTTITATESGIAGVTITALTTGSVTLQVATDSSKIESEISALLTQYNSLQNAIGSFTETPDDNTQPTDAASILSNDSLVNTLPSDLRRTLTASPGTGTIRSLEDIGIASSSENNLLTFSDTSLLAAALLNNLDEVKNLFSDSTNGLAHTLETLIDTQIDTVSGAFPTRTTNITKQQTNLDDSISALELQIAQKEERLVASFSVLEQFQSRSSKILEFLQQRNNS